MDPDYGNTASFLAIGLGDLAYHKSFLPSELSDEKPIFFFQKSNIFKYYIMICSHPTVLVTLAVSLN